ncbi:MAG TPA: tetratricopeptide repeat protein [Candidatus Hydrogenedentes bacterium]|nr:tetratricopeptide repeat protein [Candidatus Hydrogenedentota bacterium]
MKLRFLNRRAEYALGLGLVAAVLLVFCQALWCEFIAFDDAFYVTDNVHVVRGLTWRGMVWAFTTTDHGCNWHPATSLSHMVDCALFGLNPAGHHAVGLGLHAGNTLLLFVILRRITGCRWRSALVAVVFGLHPLRVESVVWASERKDVLSGLFWMLSLLAYLRYVGSPSRIRYGVVCVVFVLGLMAKPMLVSLPFVLLLLDYWPLGRLLGAEGGPRELWRQGRRLVWEKTPLFVLAGASCVVTLIVQRTGGAMRSVESIGLPWRLANAIVAYVAYIGKTFWPTGLAVFYPHPGSGLPVWQIVGAAGVLVGVTAFVVFGWRRRKYLVTGWLWYVGTLFPVIGIVQVGSQAMADRYTYLPQIGLLIMAVWAGTEWAGERPYRRAVAWCLAGVYVLGLSLLTWFQVGYWRNSEALFEHALAVTSDNAVAHNCLGIALCEAGRDEEGIGHYQEALRIRPGYSEALGNLGAAFLQEGRLGDAVPLLTRAVDMDSRFVKARHNLGVALLSLGRIEEAVGQLTMVVAAKPDDAEAHNNLGAALGQRGDTRGAIAAYERAVALEPEFVAAYVNLGKALAKHGAFDEAVARYVEALRLEPNRADAHFGLGVTLERKGDAEGAIAAYERALALDPEFVSAYVNLGNALAGKGAFEQALERYREALRLDPNQAATHYNLGMALRNMGRTEEAKGHWEEVIRLAPGHPAARAAAGELEKIESLPR